MDKPLANTVVYYNYHECRDYLQKKYGYDERNYQRQPVTPGSHYTTSKDFWLWLCDHEDIHNGGYVTFSQEILAEWQADEAIPDWAAEIYTHYLDEFADDLGTVEFCTWW